MFKLAYGFGLDLPNALARDAAALAHDKPLVYRVELLDQTLNADVLGERPLT